MYLCNNILGGKLGYDSNGMALRLSESSSSISGSQSAYFCINIRNRAGYGRGIALGYHSSKVYLINGYYPETSSWESIQP